MKRWIGRFVLMWLGQRAWAWWQRRQAGEQWDASADKPPPG